MVVDNFGYWVHFRRLGNGIISDGCISEISDKKILKSSLLLKNNKLGFEYPGICVDQKNEVGSHMKKAMAFYGLDNFYAFRIQDGEFIDIKNEIFKELGI